jgi:hypothetical protein
MATYGVLPRFYTEHYRFVILQELECIQNCVYTSSVCRISCKRPSPDSLHAKREARGEGSNNGASGVVVNVDNNSEQPRTQRQFPRDTLPEPVMLVLSVGLP